MSDMRAFRLDRDEFAARSGGYPLKHCAPFVENSRGVLVHRPRKGSIYNVRAKPHISIRFWCGMTVSTSGDHLAFIASPRADQILCERCETAAVNFGHPRADTIAGRHCHVGRTVAVRTCCGEQS
jgi:hypothetical protein